jgi:hypothetical protein
MLIDDWNARVASIGGFLLRFFSDLALSAATPIVRWMHLGRKLAPDTDDFRVMRANIACCSPRIPSRAWWAAPGTAPTLPAGDVW